MSSEEVAAIYEQERALVFNYVLKNTGDWHVAEDLTSATFEVLLQRWPINAPPRWWLLHVAKHQIVSHWRRERRRKVRYFYPDSGLADPALADEGGIESVIDACDGALAAAMLRAMLAQCTDEQLQIVRLRYVLNRSAIDVAAMLGLTKHAYNKRHNQLMHRLGGMLGAPKPRRTCAPATDCEVCGAPGFSRGRCRKHYEAMRREERMQERRAAVEALW